MHCLRFLSVLLTLTAASCSTAQPAPPAVTPENAQAEGALLHSEDPADADNTTYDAALAEKLRADEYGMAQYVVAFLRAGPNRDRPEAEAEELQRAHMDDINRLAEEGKLVVAGPFMDDGELRGIYVFDVTSLDEARKLTESDPAVQAGHLVLELHPWFSSAALRQVNGTHQRIAKTKI